MIVALSPAFLQRLKEKNKMNNSPKKVLTVASACLSAAGIVFLCLLLLGYERTWTLPAILGCVLLSTLFQVISAHKK